MTGGETTYLFVALDRVVHLVELEKTPVLVLLAECDTQRVALDDGVRVLRLERLEHVGQRCNDVARTRLVWQQSFSCF